MNRFEHLVHTRRRDRGELSVDAICEAWVESQAELFGDSVEITDGYRIWWSYVPHFINTPATSTPTPTGSCWRCRSTAASARRASRSSRATWSCSPRAARAAPRSSAQIVGIDLADPGFWDAGLALIDEQLERRRAARRGAAPRAPVARPACRERSSWRSTTLTISLIT